MQTSAKEEYEEVTVKLLINKAVAKSFDVSVKKEIEGKAIIMVHHCPEHKNAIVLLAPTNSDQISSACFEKIFMPLFDTIVQIEFKELVKNEVEKINEVKNN